MIYDSEGPNGNFKIATVPFSFFTLCVSSSFQNG